MTPKAVARAEAADADEREEEKIVEEGKSLRRGGRGSVGGEGRGGRLRMGWGFKEEEGRMKDRSKKRKGRKTGEEMGRVTRVYPQIKFV